MISRGLTRLSFLLLLLLTSSAFAASDWNKERLCFGDEAYIKGIGECQVIAEYSDSVVSVVDKESRVHQVDYACRYFLKLPKNYRGWNSEQGDRAHSRADRVNSRYHSGATSDADDKRLRRRYMRFSDWQKAFGDEAPEESNAQTNAADELLEQDN